MKWKQTLLFLFFLIAGIILGAVLGDVGANVGGALAWLNFGETFAIGPFPIDLAILKFTFGLEMGINVAQIICITISFFVYIVVNKKLR
ncbi:MAG: DUF4321 domain-containing protein [Oscillospiraceae bacterium]|nr:DUF4321 domain-containing protein [Oscillospiraceae bacterium]MBQ8732734.1 DUF4321 domain-containing protein [Oscillospiraceae bacterium]